MLACARKRAASAALIGAGGEAGWVFGCVGVCAKGDGGVGDMPGGAAAVLLLLVPLSLPPPHAASATLAERIVKRCGSLLVLVMFAAVETSDVNDVDGIDGVSDFWTARSSWTSFADAICMGYLA